MLQLRHYSVRKILGNLMDFMRTFLSILFILFSAVSFAGTVPKLYSVELPINVQTEAPSDAQILEGLKQVLVKVSGNRSLHSKPIIQQQLPAARSFLQQFSFTSTLVDGVKKDALALDFSRISIDQLIESTGMKPLGSQRPTLLLWLASDQSGVQEYVTVENPLMQIVNDSVNARGLPLQLPLLDLADQTAMPVSDLWGLFENSAQVASQRYRPDAVLVARLQVKSSGITQFEGVLLQNGGAERIAKSGDIQNVLNDVLDKVSGQLFTPVVTHGLNYFQEGLPLHVSNIDSLSDYVDLTNLLKALPIVNDVKPEWVRGTDVTMRLQLDGGEQQLKQALSIEERLQVMDRQLKADGLNVLSYRWQG